MTFAERREADAASEIASTVADVTGEDTAAPLANALTVQEVCSLPIMSSATVIAGSSGLGRSVARLNMMTVPDIARWTKEHELLLTTGYPLPRPVSSISSLVDELDACGVSALAVKFDAYLEELPPATLDVADRLGFPILCVPQELAFDDLLSAVFSTIANRQAIALSRAHDAHEALLQVSLRGTLDDIVMELSRSLSGTGVLCAGSRGEVLVSHLSAADKDALDTHGILRADGRVARLAVGAGVSDSSAIVVRQLPADEVAPGSLIVVRPNSSFDQHEQMMIDQAAMVAALNISRTVAIHGVTRRFASNALHSLLVGPRSEVDDVVARSASFGWELDRRTRVMVALSNEPTDPRAREEMLFEWESMVQATDSGAATGTLGTTLVAVCAADHVTEALAGKLITRLSQYCSVQVSIGISEEISVPAALNSGWLHGQTAAELAQRVDETPHIRRYETLGLLRLVDAVSDKSEIDHFLQANLGSVFTLPKRDREEMLSTLRGLVKNQFNIAETARAMHFHYNTVRYRVHKLEQLLGNFTENSQLSTNVCVALDILPLRPQVYSDE